MRCAIMKQIVPIFVCMVSEKMIEAIIRYYLHGRLQ